MSKRLLVGSVYASSEPTEMKWFLLKTAYLDATTQDFDHVVHVNESDVGAFEKHVEVIGNMRGVDVTALHGSALHVRGLQSLHNYFISVQDKYDRFLFLDGDAFPIRKNWESLLSEKMSISHSVSSCAKDIAVVLRPELCEFRWHGCVLFTTRAGLNNVQFQFKNMKYLSEWGKDFLGNFEHDIHINYQAPALRDRVYPLMRTNQLNIHPAACGVYYDMFYHHAFGSMHGPRRGRFQKLGKDVPFQSLREGGKYGYGSLYTDPDYPYEEFYSDLMADPTSFINKLAGWSQSEYPEAREISSKLNSGI